MGIHLCEFGRAIARQLSGRALFDLQKKIPQSLAIARLMLEAGLTSTFL